MWNNTIPVNEISCLHYLGKIDIFICVLDCKRLKNFAPKSDLFTFSNQNTQKNYAIYIRCVGVLKLQKQPTVLKIFLTIFQLMKIFKVNRNFNEV